MNEPTAQQMPVPDRPEVDPWGLDPRLYELAVTLAGARWDVDVSGAEHLPSRGGALLVLYRRVGLSEPSIVASALSRETGRAVRTVGMPDWPVVGAIARRLGCGVAHPDEIRGMLAARHLVAVALDSQPLHGGLAGSIDPARLVPAIDLGVPVLPVVATGWEIGRVWQVVVGEPVASRTNDGIAGATRKAVQALLDESA